LRFISTSWKVNCLQKFYYKREIESVNFDKLFKAPYSLYDHIKSLIARTTSNYSIFQKIVNELKEVILHFDDLLLDNSYMKVKH
jgi:hypothetical protein